MKILPISLLALACSAAPSLAAGPYVPTYTDVAACASEDLGPDEFVRSCEGPAGYGAELHYFDGRISVAFGLIKVEGGLDQAATNVIKDPPMAAASGEPYGKRIEWLAGPDGTPCAAIIRVRTEKGEVLITGGTVKDSPWAENTKNEYARNAAESVCDEGPSRSADSVEYEAKLKAEGDTIEGKGLSLCSQCKSPDLVTLTGAGTARAAATAKLTLESALAQCKSDGFIDVDDPKAVRACADDAMEFAGGKTFTAKADCTRQEITDTSGVRYRYLRMGEDYGGVAPLWKNLSTGETANVSRSGDSARVTQQYVTLCPGAFVYEGFDRF